MAGKITSDDIKAALAAEDGSNKADWKRVSKRKNADGNWEREFINKKTGATGVATEIPGEDIKVTITPKDGLSAEANGNFAPDSEEAAARKIIDIMMNGDEEGEFFVDDEELIAEAGQTLAQHFCFAVKTDDEGILEEMDMEGMRFYAIISPLAYYRDNKVCYDQPSPIDGLLPEGEDMNDCGTWVFEELGETAEDIFDELSRRGFVWDKSFQDFIDDSLTDTLEKRTAPKPAATAKRPTPKA